MAKVKPETHQQAAEWDRRNNGYIRLGLCYRCASQAAWGHQLGFSVVHPPCEGCQPLVATFPEEKSNGWRTAPRVAMTRLATT